MRRFSAAALVCDPGPAQTLHQRLPVELRIVITHRLYAMLCQQAEEVLQRMRRVTDGENGFAHVSNQEVVLQVRGEPESAHVTYQELHHTSSRKGLSAGLCSHRLMSGRPRLHNPSGDNAMLRPTVRKPEKIGGDRDNRGDTPKRAGTSRPKHAPGARLRPEQKRRGGSNNGNQA
jgi:hypothetical protein